MDYRAKGLRLTITTICLCITQSSAIFFLCVFMGFSMPVYKVKLALHLLFLSETFFASLDKIKSKTIVDFLNNTKSRKRILQKTKFMQSFYAKGSCLRVPLTPEILKSSRSWTVFNRYGSSLSASRT